MGFNIMHNLEIDDKELELLSNVILNKMMNISQQDQKFREVEGNDYVFKEAIQYSFNQHQALLQKLLKLRDKDFPKHLFCK